ncbi:hypothetical protein L6164_021835 [Bauhinia variegata]|uniref:Uncharacterized protein n=1 Tax=Bauhinia variegata TaxID=167791 RepID=A0ACB9MGK3_BAUVA|nr:hypothetical protein L6164_021835 [Bauhinia variegata]
MLGCRDLLELTFERSRKRERQIVARKYGTRSLLVMFNQGWCVGFYKGYSCHFSFLLLQVSWRVPICYCSILLPDSVWANLLAHGVRDLPTCDFERGRGIMLQLIFYQLCFKCCCDFCLLPVKGTPRSREPFSFFLGCSLYFVSETKRFEPGRYRIKNLEVYKPFDPNAIIGH